MTPNGSDTPTPRRPDRVIAGIAVASSLVAVLVRIPTFLAARHLSFDDGVYGASAIAMRHGGVPFRDVFSSQGPLFLPLVFLGDLIGLRSVDSPRVIAVLAGACAAGFASAIAAQVADTPARSRVAAAIAGLLAATSGALWWTTGPITSDGPTVALGVAAVWTACTYRTRPTTLRALIVGLLLGVAVGVKLIMAAPAMFVCGLLLLTSSRRRDVIVAGAPILLVPLLAASTFGLDTVWEQVVTYHTRSSVGSRNPLVHLGKLVSTLLDRDLLLTVSLLVAIAGMFITAWHARKAPAERAPAMIRITTGLTPIGVWLVLTIAVLAIQQPLWRNHVAYVIPPMAIIVGVVFARGGATTLALITAGALALPYQVVHTRPLWDPAPYRGDEAAIVAQLQTLPDDAQVISDDPGLVWRAGRRTPDNFVDTSVLRITSPVRGIVLTTATVSSAAAHPEVCAVAITSPDRFGALPGLADSLQDRGYTEAFNGTQGRSLWLKQPCPGGGPTGR